MLTWFLSKGFQTMIVPIWSNDGKSKEWALIEIQGDFEHGDSKVVDDDAIRIGYLFHKTNKKIPLLIMRGESVFKGKEVVLPKPFAILNKQTNENDQVEYHIKGIVKKKIVFKDRPTPLVHEKSKKLLD